MNKTIPILLILFNIFLFGNTLKDAIVAYNQKNFKEAKKLFENAINQENSIQANYFLGKMYLFGEGIQKDPQKALLYLQKAEKTGNIKAKCLKIKALLSMNKQIPKEDMEFLNLPQISNIKECSNITTRDKDKR